MREGSYGIYNPIARATMAKKKTIFWLALLLPVIALFEIASYAIVKKTVPSRILQRVYAEKRLVHSDHTANGGSKPRFVHAGAATDQAAGLVLFHPVLGWDYPPGLFYEDALGRSYSHGPRGERRCVTKFDTSLIATYGDSFTYCADVSDENTWQYFLGKNSEPTCSISGSEVTGPIRRC